MIIQFLIEFSISEKPDTPEPPYSTSYLACTDIPLSQCLTAWIFPNSNFSFWEVRGKVRPSLTRRPSLCLFGCSRLPPRNSFFPLLQASAWPENENSLSSQFQDVQHYLCDATGVRRLLLPTETPLFSVARVALAVAPSFGEYSNKVLFLSALYFIIWTLKRKKGKAAR